VTPYTHQIEGANEAYDILGKHALVYIAYEERTGKTLTSILVAEMSKADRILVLTKKKALDGWHETLGAFTHTKHYTVTNYHGAVKIKGNYDLVILDEAHSYLSASPKVGKIWKDVFKLTKDKPIIYLSATPYAQGYRLLFNQFRLSTWSPFKGYKNFYAWHRTWGIPDKARTPYGLVETYAKFKPQVFDLCKHLFITKTRQELNFEHEPEDLLRYVDLKASTRDLYNKCMRTEMIRLPTGEVGALDSPMKLRTTLHMLEGGVAKIEDKYIVLPNEEKIDAIKGDFGDTEELCIMYQYIAEGEKLRKAFKHAKILQGTAFAEGISLAHVENLVVYSQDFSTARHSQRRARQANKQRKTPINVVFYLIKDGISEQVYTTVAKNKTNFIDKLFSRKEL